MVDHKIHPCSAPHWSDFITALVFIEGIPINVEAHVREIEFQYSKKAVLEGSVQGDCEDVGTIILQNQWINYFGTNTTVSLDPRQLVRLKSDGTLTATFFCR